MYQAMQWGNLSKPIRTGVVLLLLYLLWMGLLLWNWTTKENSDAMLVAVFTSFPTSLLLAQVSPFFDKLGTYESHIRQFAEWGFFTVAGCLNSFLIGYLLHRFLFSTSERSAISESDSIKREV